VVCDGVPGRDALATTGGTLVPRRCEPTCKMDAVSMTSDLAMRQPKMADAA
jgi:hypothetical protein